MGVWKWIGCASIAAFLCGCNGPDSSGTSASAAALPANSSTTERELLAFDPYRPFTHWHYSVRKDPMTDRRTSTASLSSEEVVQLGFPYEGKQSATLVLRHGPGNALDVFMYLKKGQIQCNGFSDYGCPLRVRLDDSSPELMNGNPPDDNDPTYIFLPSANRLIHQISAAKKLRIEVTVYQQGTRVFTFDVGGLDMPKLEISAPAPSLPRKA